VYIARGETNNWCRVNCVAVFGEKRSKRRGMIVFFICLLRGRPINSHVSI